ncbi:MAG TPA: tripartite tricarboxylate transporter substrate binding protein [Bordetella sp.]|nr:tripartite tricarboxylate transporter substrate binding protein [Bordetella sp.]
MISLFKQAVALCALSAVCASVQAQQYPSRPITLIVPFGAGGNNDVSGRIIAERMGELLGQPVVVENRSGAAGAIGATAVARAKNDGYTLGFLSSGPLAANPGLYKSLPYDSAKDFAPVARTTTSPGVLVVHPTVPASNLKELVAYLKANPGKVNYGTSGAGSSPHLSGALFESLAGARMTHIPYKGGSQVNADLLSGEIQLSFSPILEVVPHIKAGKLKAIAVTSAQRSPLLPEVPAVAEMFPGYEVITWNGVVAPAGTPPEVIAKLNAAVTGAVNTPEVKTKLLQLGLEAAPSSPQEFEAFISSETGNFNRLIKLAGVEPQ